MMVRPKEEIQEMPAEELLEEYEEAEWVLAPDSNYVGELREEILEWLKYAATVKSYP